jgi:methionine-rich copper-binding protein CopC
MSSNRQPSRRLALAAIAAVLIPLLLPSAALGHVVLESSSPAAGSTVTGPIERIELTFNEPLQDRSRFAVRLGDTEVARGRPDPARSNVMTVDASRLGPGEYTVSIFAVGTDGHAERPTFSFTIIAGAPETPSPSPSPSATPTASAPPSASPSPSAPPSPSPSASPQPSPDPGPAASTGGDVVLPIIATLIVIGGIGLWVLRRQRRV